MCTLIHEYTYLYDCSRDVPCLFFYIDDSTAQKKINRGEISPAFLFMISLLLMLRANLPSALM